MMVKENHFFIARFSLYHEVLLQSWIGTMNKARTHHMKSKARFLGPYKNSTVRVHLLKFYSILCYTCKTSYYFIYSNSFQVIKLIVYNCTNNLISGSKLCWINMFGILNDRWKYLEKAHVVGINHSCSHNTTKNPCT